MTRVAAFAETLCVDEGDVLHRGKARSVERGACAGESKPQALKRPGLMGIWRHD